MVSEYLNLKILVIEDNPGDFFLINEYILENFENPEIFHVQTYYEFEQFLTSQEGIKIILLDLTLPDGSGEDLIKNVIKRADDIPVIVLTGLSNKDFGYKSMSHGVSDYLQKDELQSTQLHKSIIYAIQRQKFNYTLKQSEEKYKNLFQLSPIPMWICDWTTFRFLYVNDAAIRHYGYSETEFLSMTVFDIRPDDEERSNANVLISCAQNGTTNGQGVNFKQRKKNGDVIDIEIQSTEVDFEGKRARLVIATDITSKKLAEDSLLASEQRFKTLVQDSGDLILIITPEGNLTYVSPNHEMILGYEVPKILEKNIRHFLHPDDFTLVSDFLQALQLKRRMYSVPYRVRKNDGNFIWIESIATNALDDSTVRGFVINSRNVTARIADENRIQEISERFEAVAKATSDVIYDFDFESNSIYLTGSNYHSLFGYQFIDNVTDIQFYRDSLHPDEKKWVYDFFNEAATNPKQTHFELQYQFLRHDGTYADVLDRFDIIWRNGKPIKKVGAIEDITERKFQETILALEKEIYELNASPKVTFNAVVNRLLTQIEAILRDSLCVISLINDDQSVTFIAEETSLDGDFLQQLNDSKGLGATCSSALYSGDKVFVTDLENNAHRSGHSDLALSYGFKACWAIPVNRGSSKTIANFAAYYKNYKSPNHSEIALVERIANLIGVLVENHNAFEETERAKERYDIVAKATSDTIWDWNIQEDNFIWNKGIQGIFGYRKEDVGTTSKWWFDRIHPEDSIKMSVKLYSFLEQKTEKWQDEYRFACADGTYKYVFDRGFLVKDSTGKAIRMIGAMQDVTRQKEEEQRLKLLETVITQTKDAVIISESEKSDNTIPKIVFVNPAFTRMTGYNADEVIGRPPTIFMERKSFKSDFDRLADALKNKKEYKLETLNNKKDGEEYWVNFSMIPITNKEGEHSHWISIQRDITEEKRQEKEKEQLIRELTQNNKDLKQFSYITSHNLRAPLSNLTGLLNLLEDIPIENAELSEIMEGFSKSTHLLNETINDLVKVVIIKDNPSIHKEEVSIKEIFDNVYDQLSLLVNLHKLDIHVQLEQVSILNINKAYLESIFLNLLTNAIKYRNPNRQLKISVTSHAIEDTVELIFTDNGIGIDLQRNKDKIFGLYQRFHNYPDSKGLGLYLVKSQVESMGGTISVESNVDVGTTFTLIFKKQIT